MNKKNTIVITAPSGAGKTSVIQSIINDDPKKEFTFSISHTTRYKRESEVHGKDYFFIKKDEFESMIEKNEFIEWAKVGDFYYGTSLKELERASFEKKRIIFDIDIQGFQQFKKKDIQAIYLFIKPPSIEILEQRLRKRGLDNDEQIKKRIIRAKKELKFEIQFDHVIMNDTLDKCIKEVKNIIY